MDVSIRGVGLQRRYQPGEVTDRDALPGRPTTFPGTIVRVTVPLVGQLGVPAGSGATAVPHNQTMMPPGTWCLPKWIWACVTGATRLEKVSVYARV
jgi:hypothetical protein